MTCRTIAFALAVALAAPALAGGPDTRSQLEKSIGLPKAEAGLYSPLQLAMIKRIRERSDLTEQEQDFRVQAIKAGRSPLLTFAF